MRFSSMSMSCLVRIAEYSTAVFAFSTLGAERVLKTHPLQQIRHHRIQLQFLRFSR